MEIEDLRFERLIVHEALKKTPENEDVQAENSEGLVELDPAGDAEVRKRIASALGRSSHSVELDIEEADQGSTFEISSLLLTATDDEFVDLSQRLARKLSVAQASSGSTRSGLAVIIQGTIMQERKTKRIILLIKADGESAFVRERDKGRNYLKLINNLFLGPQQKLYKIGCFVEKSQGTPPRTADEFSATVFDHLMTDSGDRDAAAYFYRQFLGCRLAESAKKRTRQFYELTSDFINQSPAIKRTEKIDLKNALKVTLKSEKPQFSVTDFADEFLRQEIRQDYKKFMKTKKFPSGAVTKDTSAIKNSLRVQNVVFSSAVKIVAPADDFRKVVKIGREVEGWTHVEILGKVENE